MRTENQEHLARATNLSAGIREERVASGRKTFGKRTWYVLSGVANIMTGAIVTYQGGESFFQNFPAHSSETAFYAINNLPVALMIAGVGAAIYGLERVSKALE